jgi:hypothetical protein
MPNFKKSDGFSLGGNPFTMKKGSKEITTDGSFRKEATDKMGGYGSPLFAIAGREGRGAGAAYEDTTTDMAADIDAAMSEGKEVAGALGLGGEEETPSEESASALGNEELQAAKEKDTNLATVESDSDYDNEMRRKMGYN